MTTAPPALLARETGTRHDAVGWLTLYAALLFFVPSRLYVGPLGSAGSPAMLWGLVSLVVWFLLVLGRPRAPTRAPQPIRLALAGFLVAVGLSYVSAVSQPMSSDEISPADVALLAVASWTGTLLLTHDGITRRDRLDAFLWRLAVCAGLIAALGLIQIATRQLWVDEITIPGLATSPPYTLSSRGGFPRPAGTSIHPIEYGVILAMMLPITLHIGLHHRRLPTLVRWAPAAAVSAIIPLTSSRSAYLGAAIALVVYVVGWSVRHRTRLVALIVGGALAILLVRPNFFGLAVGLFTRAADDPSITSRTDSFSLAFEFVANHPWFGRGLGTFLPKYRILDNQYLLLLITVGVVGTVAFLALGTTFVIAMLRLRAGVTDPATRDLALALAAAVAAGFSCLFMFDAFAYPMTMGTLFLLLGVGGALRRIEGAAAGAAGILR